jgi:L,D-transpeptidase catalytic domain
VAAGVVGAIAAGRPGDEPVARERHLATPDLAPPPRSAFAIGKAVPIGRNRHETRWAPVLRPVAARRAPRGDAKVVARLGTRTPEGTTNIVVAVARSPDLWVKVRLAALPNGRSAWVPRSALGGYTTVTTRLVVSRNRLTATLLKNGRRILRAPVAVGTPAAPTPPGEFYVRNRLTRYRSPFYGPVALGTSARSETLDDWPGGGFVGIHGTDRPDLVPGRVSHGCIRMRNRDVLRLARLMPVGTPVSIQ